ncbi:MAG: ParB N-terminal domain-containing protein, partial [Bacteroidota bacterium]
MTDLTKVTLPDGREVEVVTALEQLQELHLAHEATFYIHPSLISPLPNQPRTEIGREADEWADWLANLEANGVRQPIRITPKSKAPWLTGDGDDDTFFIISGHRRKNGADDVGLKAVPV